MGVFYCWTFARAGKQFPWRTLLTGILICAGGSFHFGIQLSNLNPAEGIFHRFINETTFTHYGNHSLSDSAYRLVWSAVLNMQTVGSIFGVLPLVKLSEKFGRRRTFYVSSSFTLTGLICQSLSKIASSYELLALGRFLTGIGTGLASPLEGMYLNEISPVHLRGYFCSMIGIFLELGFIVGGVLALPVFFGTSSLWHWMFVLEIPPVLLLLVTVPFLHESPRYLLARGDETACRRSLKHFGHTDVDASFREIESELKSQKEKITWSQVWAKMHLRRAALLGVATVLLAATSGITVIDYFSTIILINVGFTPSAAQYASVAVFVQCFFSAVLGGILIDKVGRRLLLLVTTLSLILTNSCLMVSSLIYASYTVRWAGFVSVASCFLLSFSFGVGPSILQWTVTSEMVPQNARSTVQLFVMIVQKVAVVIVGAMFYPLQGIIGPYAFFLYILPLCLLWLIFFRWFPETKEKGIVEVMVSLGYTKVNERNMEST